MGFRALFLFREQYNTGCNAPDSVYNYLSQMLNKVKNKNRKLRQEDVSLVRRCFYQEKIVTRQNLCRKTGLSSGSAAGILQELLDTGEILYVSDAASTGGRRSKQYALNPDYAHIGMISCRHQKGRYYLDGHVIACDGKNLDTKITESDKGTAEDLKNCARSLVRKDSRIRVLVIAIPGYCQDGVVQVCDFHHLEGENLKDLISLKIPVVIENDVNVACIGFQSERKCQNMALIYQPDMEYSGAGIIIDGRLYNGAGHKAGEMRYLYGDEPVEKLSDPAEQLWKEITAIQAVVDPEVTGWYSDVVNRKDLKKYTPDSQMNLIHIGNLDELIEKGLAAIGRDCLMNENKGEKAS